MAFINGNWIVSEICITRHLLEPFNIFIINQQYSYRFTTFAYSWVKSSDMGAYCGAFFFGAAEFDERD